MASDQPLPSKALNDAFADYEAQLTKTADKRLKGRQSAIRYNRRRFAHALKSLQNAKVTLFKDDDRGGRCNAAAAVVSSTTTTTKKIEEERTIAPTSSSSSLKDRASTRHQNCLLRRLSLVETESTKMRTIVSDSAAADERLENIRRDPRRRKIDVDIEEIVKELDEIDNKCRRGKVKASTT